MSPTVGAADQPAADSIGDAISALADRSPFDEFTSRLHALAAELSDIGHDLRALAEQLEEDPQRLAEIRERRQLLRDLRRKYGDSLADVIDLPAGGAGSPGRARELRAAGRRAGAGALAGGGRRASSRAGRVAAVRRSGAVEACCGGPRRRALAGDAARRDGRHRRRARLRATTSPSSSPPILGLPMLPLSRVASGGELARTMLALRLVLTEAPETLVFDEVDAGIGGTAATAVAESLARLGRRHQVMCVTHLAQVAALADTQIMVTKTVTGGSVATRRRRPLPGSSTVTTASTRSPGC